jgi:uncharacterized protein (TIGR03083 family)
MTDAAGTTVDDADLGVIYRDTRERLSALVLSLAADGWRTPVPACPGWTVHDVVAHLVAVNEDVLAGRLTRPPTDEETAAQVDRRRGKPTDEMVEEWGTLAPAFDEFLSQVRVWPAALDVLTHEQDIRGAIDQPGARDVLGIRLGASILVDSLRPPVNLVVHLDDVEHDLGGGDADAHGAPLQLRTTSFEAFRFRLGRRSRSQLGALAWSGDPAPILDALVVFGPSPTDIVE